MVHISQLWEPLVFLVFACSLIVCGGKLFCAITPYEEKTAILIRSVWDEDTELYWKDGFMLGFNCFIICSLVQVICTYALRFFASRFLVESIPIVFGATADFIMLLVVLLGLFRKKFEYSVGLLVGFFVMTQVVSFICKYVWK